MNVDFRLNPFPHIFIDEFYDQHQYDVVWREILHLYPKMMLPTETGAARDQRGIPRKKGLGIFLSKVYANASYSDIEMINRFIISQEFKQKIDFQANESDILYFKLYKHIEQNSKIGTLLQLYVNGDYYRPHQDSSLFTSVIVLNSKEKQYVGGELYFPEYDHVIDLNNNQMVIFPSIITHEVKEVKMQSENPEDGRFSISMLMSSDFSEPNQ